MGKKKVKKKTCEASTPVCSGQMMAKYSVNRSYEVSGEAFTLCGPCKVYLARTNTVKPVRG